MLGFLRAPSKDQEPSLSFVHLTSTKSSFAAALLGVADGGGASVGVSAVGVSARNVPDSTEVDVGGLSPAVSTGPSPADVHPDKASTAAAGTIIQFAFTCAPNSQIAWAILMK